MKKFFLFLGLAIVMSSTSLVMAANFKDVKPGSWYENPVNQLQRNGIIQGYPDGTFKPEKNVNRAELAKIIHNLQLYMNNTYELKGVNKQTQTQLKKTAKEHKDKGHIEGSLSYLKGKSLPQDLRICAENIHTNKEYCTTDIVRDKKYVSGYGYRLEVLVGEYRVYSQSNKFNQEKNRNNYKAYYSEYIHCGMGKNCTSHQPMIVNVGQNRTATNINPNDWYDGTGGMSTIAGSLQFLKDKSFPSDLRICAHNVQTGEEFCTTDVIWSPQRYAGGRGYELRVPAGEYQVYSQSRQFNQNQNSGNNYDAYYSEYVQCGMGGNCTSHKPVTLSIGENESMANINPNDWYNNSNLSNQSNSSQNQNSGNQNNR